jgi:hypothetical protein
MVDEKDEISGLRDSRESSLARLLMPFFSTTVRAVPHRTLQFSVVAFVGCWCVCFSRKSLMALTLFTKFSFEIARAKHHIVSDTSFALASD